MQTNFKPTPHPLNEINFAAQSSLACVIEASAGTGKTWTIERLYVKALLELPQLALTQILVVTFTNAAAAELKARIQAQIKTTIDDFILCKNARLNPCGDPFIDGFILQRPAELLVNDITLLTRALQIFDNAAIYTIHGFCNKVIKDFQLACNVNYPFELISDHRDLVLGLLRDFYRAQILQNPMFSGHLPQVVRNIAQLFERDYNKSIFELIYDKLPKDLFRIQGSGVRLVYQGLGDFELSQLKQELSLTQETLPSDYALPIELAGKKRLSKTDLTLINKQRKLDFTRTLLAAVVNYLAAKYPSAKSLSNQVNYDELIQIVASGVVNDPQFATTLYQSYPLAFIDEFQDTDDLQWSIFSYIYALQAGGRGQVVVVGDPKQAIYRFRGADIDTYVAAVAQINNTKELNENRRSHPHIMNFVNQLFNPQHQTNYPNFLGAGVSYQAVQAKVRLESLAELPEPQEIARHCHALGVKQDFYAAEVQLVSVGGVSSAEREQQILRAVTFEILGLLKLNPQLKGKIAILTSSNQQANGMVAFLRKYGVKAVELKLGSIYATSTAQELLQILEVVENLNQRQKFNAVLSTRLVNFALDKLANPAAYQSEFEELYQRFYGYKQILHKQGIIAFVYQLIADLFISVTVSHGLTNRELSNLLQLAELLHSHACQLNNFYELLYWFKRKISRAGQSSLSELDSESDELVRLDNDDEQIVITTQHKSKGLEYEVLFCPYFKADEKINRRGYKLPFFANYRSDTGEKNFELISTPQAAEGIISRDNSEIHRLNYVALTRAKRRIYIYLKATSIKEVAKPKSGQAALRYDAASNTNKLDELFGYLKENPSDRSHPLFNYPDFFAAGAHEAIKSEVGEQLPGVLAYQRRISLEDLERLKLTPAEVPMPGDALCRVKQLGRFYPAYARQSYTALTRSTAEDERDYYCRDSEAAPAVSASEILQRTSLSGAKFGILFHELCENYPLDSRTTERILVAHNLPSEDSSSYRELIEQTFAYPLDSAGLCLASIEELMHEFEFNLEIRQSLSLAEHVAQLLAQHYGVNHPFSQACRTLTRIEQGFLTGFIDLFYFAQGKFWILDYKTNTLADYSSPSDPLAVDNPLVISLAEHHYYLQYLLYLVAIKRYLEFRLNIPDASELIGGAVYFYVRGVFVADPALAGGVFRDESCQALVAELDRLLKGESHE